MNLQKTRMEEFKRVDLNELETNENIEKLQVSLDRIQEIIDERVVKKNDLTKLRH